MFYLYIFKQVQNDLLLLSLLLLLLLLLLSFLSIFEKCNHNIIFGKIKIRVSLPLSCICEVWDYRKANVKSIQKANQTFDWVKALGNLSVDGKVNVRNETLMQIFRNYIPNKSVKCYYCQTPWMND